MALYWDFERDYVGQMKNLRRKCICNLYTGNALLIVVGETEKEYGLHWFASDEQHLAKMLADDRCREDLKQCEFIFKGDQLSDKKVKKFIKMVQGVSTITLLSTDAPLKRKIYTALEEAELYADENIEDWLRNGKYQYTPEDVQKIKATYLSEYDSRSNMWQNIDMAYQRSGLALQLKTEE